MTTATARRQKPSLARITDKVPDARNRILIHGGPGSGKTSFASHFQNPIFIQSPGETGLETLVQSEQINPTPFVTFGNESDPVTQAQCWEDVIDAVEMLTYNDHEYKTVVMDVFNGIERLCHEHCCKRDFGGDWGEKGFASFQKGYDVSLNYWRDLLSRIDTLRMRRGMTFIGLAHTRTQVFANPGGSDWERWVPDLHKKTWSMTLQWSDICLFFNFEMYAKQEKGEKAKGVGGETRIAYTSNNAAWDAKNRHGLPPTFDLGKTSKEAFDSFRGSMLNAKKPAATST